nr:SCP2 sterol-binding domain-containing protein [Nitrospirota bacterium]
MQPRTTKEFFDTLPQRLDVDAAEGVAAVYQFDLSGPQGGQYILSIKDSACQVQEGVHPGPDVTLALSGEDCVGILAGRLDGMQVAMTGRLQISGDLTLAIQLKSLFPTVR